MKTFDEAFKIILKTHGDVLSANFASAREYMDNEDWTTVIEGLAVQWLQQIAKVQKPGMLMAESCSRLHGAFQLGVLVGMEMEKP